MGNTQIPAQTYSNYPTSKNIKILSEKADQFSKQRGLDTYNSSVIRRIFVQPRQAHLIEVLKSMKSQQKLQSLIDQIHNANIEILDSFYEHILRSWQPSETFKQRQLQKRQKMYSPFDRQLGICGSSNLMKQRTWEPISPGKVEIVDLKKGLGKIPGYEKYKEKGLNTIKKQEVCFIILAGGKNIRYDLNQDKQCDPFEQMPSKTSLIQLMLKKFEALGRLIDAPIHIYIMVNDEERKKKIRKIKSYKVPNPEYIEVDFLTQINYGCLDHQGRLVLTDDEQIYFHPNGSGDIWGNFEDKNFQKTGLNKFKYVQIFGVSNILQHCFDCFMIGKLALQQLPWITMAAQNLQSLDLDPVIFLNHAKSIQVRDPEEIGCGMEDNGLLQFPRKCPHLFLNNTVFSIDFILKAVNSPKWLEYRKYHCKHKKIDFRPPLSKYSSIFTFQRELSDIFAITDIFAHQKNSNDIGHPRLVGNICGSLENRVQTDLQSREENKRGVVAIMKDQQYNSPFYTKFDKIMGAVALSQMYKRWLGIAKKNGNIEKTKMYYEQKLQQICQIDPFVSLEGENLEQIIKELSRNKNNIEYPLYIGSEINQSYPAINRTASTLKESKFEKLNEFTGSW